MVISVYLSSLPVAHLRDAPRRRLDVTGDSERIHDETTESSTWFFNVYSTVTRDLDLKSSPGIEPTASSFQVERSNQLNYAGR